MKEKNTNNPGLQDEIWTALREKWTPRDAEGHTIKVDFQLLNDPANATNVLAIDVAQKVDGEWVVQTGAAPTQRGLWPAADRRAEPGAIDSNLPHRRSIPSLGSGWRGGVQRGSASFPEMDFPGEREVHGYVLSKSGEKIILRTNYQHYYVLNEILEQTSQLHGERYSGLEAYEVEQIKALFPLPARLKNNS